MYRSLTSSELEMLKSNGCRSRSWDQVSVKEGFDPSRVRNVRFSGSVSLGVFSSSVELPGGVRMDTGVYDATLHNVIIDDEVLICNVEQYIANYHVSSHAVIYQVDSLIVEGVSSFGNGTEAAVINEGGGREVPIYDGLNSHVAYLMALYRQRTTLIERLQDMIDVYVDSISSDMGTIGRHARIIGCRSLRDVKVGDYAYLHGVSRLENVSVNSVKEDPSEVGLNVIAEDVIIAEGAHVVDGVIAQRCYIGQGTELGKQYSAENSVFFANCAGFHGEACSIFAGPYTVTHHKSTLLIAALVSFLNAGSGSNQSNHMYKLGPNHQGIIERGSKTASDSYMLFPMHVGAFSVIMGRHYNNSDTSELPFSYLIEQQGESLLIPGVNLRSVGTVRDSRKWPRRDKRKVKRKDDLIIYHLLTPYTVQNILRGIDRLIQIRAQAGHSSINYFYNGVRLTRSSLEKGLSIYQLAVDRYLGNIVVNILRSIEISSKEAVLAALLPRTRYGTGQWLDVSGLLVPAELFEKLMEEVEAGVLDSLQAVNDRLYQFYESYESYEAAWVMHTITKRLGISYDEVSIGTVMDIIRRWIVAVERLDMMRCQDAEKEFAQTAKVGYGLNGTDADMDAEYRVIHGSVKTNDFIADLGARLEAKKTTCASLLEQLENLR